MTEQILLDGYQKRGRLFEVTIRQYERVKMVKDFKVAWKDRDWNLLSGDIVEVDRELASMLVGRKLAESLGLLKNRMGD